MATRNPMNERYTTEQGAGKSKRSASSAKPKRKAGETVRVESKSTAAPKGKIAKAAAHDPEKDKELAEKQALVRKYGKPTGPIYKKWTKYWIICLMAALVASLLTYFVYAWFNAPLSVEIVFMVLAYAFIIAGFWIDIAKRSPIRKATEAAALNMSSRERKAALKEIEAENAIKEAKKAERRARSGFSKKLAGGKESERKAAEVDAMIEDEKKASEGSKD